MNGDPADQLLMYTNFITSKNYYLTISLLFAYKLPQRATQLALPACLIGRVRKMVPRAVAILEEVKETRSH